MNRKNNNHKNNNFMSGGVVFHPSMPRDAIEQTLLELSSSSSSSSSHNKKNTARDIFALSSTTTSKINNDDTNNNIPFRLTEPVRPLPKSEEDKQKILEYSFPKAAITATTTVVTAVTDIPKHTIVFAKPLLVLSLKEFREKTSSSPNKKAAAARARDRIIDDSSNTNNNNNNEVFKRLAKIVGVVVVPENNNNHHDDTTGSSSDDASLQDTTMMRSVFLRSWRFAEVLPCDAAESTNNSDAMWSFMDETVAAMTFHENVGAVVDDDDDTTASADDDNATFISKKNNFDCWLCRFGDPSSSSSSSSSSSEPSLLGFTFVLRAKRNIKQGERILSSCFYQAAKQPFISVRRLLLESMSTSFNDIDNEHQQPTDHDGKPRENDDTTPSSSSSSSSALAVTSYIREFISKPYINYVEASSELARDTLRDRAKSLRAQADLDDRKKKHTIGRLMMKKEKVTKAKRLLFYSDSKIIVENVKDPRYICVEDPNRADIVYLVHSKFETANSYPNAKFISQFPEEKLFVDKAALANTVKQSFGMKSSSFPYLPMSFTSSSSSTTTTTATLAGELHLFPAAFLERLMMSTTNSNNNSGNKNDDDNNNNESEFSSSFLNPSSIWIAKSTNLARGLGHVVLDSLPWLLRMNEEMPRVLCEYVERPLLIRDGRKFDVRFMVMVCSLGLFEEEEDETERKHDVVELESEIYLYNKMFPRIAAQKYSLNSSDLHEINQHFTHSSDHHKMMMMMNKNNNNDDDINDDSDNDTNVDDEKTATAPVGKTVVDEFFRERRPLGTDLMKEFNATYGNESWENKVMPEVRRMIKLLFSKGIPLLGVPTNITMTSSKDDNNDNEGNNIENIEEYWNQRRRFRGMYGVDVMVTTSSTTTNDNNNENIVIKPILLEVTYAPDLARVVYAEPEFCDHAFNTIFRNEPTNVEKL